MRPTGPAVCAEAPTSHPEALPPSSATGSTGCGSATARPSRPAITSRRSRVRGRRRPGYAVPIYRTPPDLVRCTKPDGTTGRGRIDETGTCVPLFHARRDRGRRAGRQGPRDRPGRPIRSTCSSSRSRVRAGFRLPDGSVMRIGYADQNGREYVAHRPAAARPRHPSAGRRQHAGDHGLDARQPGRGARADARESVLYLLQGTDRAGPARRAWTCR